MGFISSGNTTGLKVFLTQKGREYLLNGTENDIIVKYFSLGDSDTNYLTEIRDGNGVVPDITGDDTGCIKSVANNASIKHFVIYNDVPVQTGTTAPPPVINKKVKLQRSDNNEFVETIDCVIHLDKYARYFMYHAFTNIINPSATIYEDLKSPIIDFYKKVNVFDENNLPLLDKDMIVIPDSPTIYKALSRTYLKANGNNNYTNEENLNNLFLFLFSSSYLENNRYAGSGAGGVMLLGREYGYSFRPAGGSPLNWFWLTTQQLETRDLYYQTDSLGNLIREGSDLFYPAAKIYSIDKTTNIAGPLIYSSSPLQFTGGTVTNNYANQYCKGFHNYTVIKNDGSITLLNNDDDGVMAHEINRLRLFVPNSPIFRLISGTEYRTDPIVFTIKPKVEDGSVSAKLRITFKYDDNVLMEGNSTLSTISSEGDKQFIEYL